MLRRLRSLQELCRSKPLLPERPFYNIGHTPERRSATPTPVSNDCESTLQPNFVDIIAHVSTPKPNCNSLSLNCADIVGQGDLDLPSVTEKSAKRLHSYIDSEGAVPNVDTDVALPALLSPVRKRSRQDAGAPIVLAATVGAGDADIAATEKSPAVVSSLVEKSIDSTNVELSLSAGCEPCTISSASVALAFGRSGSCNSLSRPASAVRSGNSSPRTWPSRRDLGQVVFIRICVQCEYVQYINIVPSYVPSLGGQ